MVRTRRFLFGEGVRALGLVAAVACSGRPLPLPDPSVRGDGIPDAGGLDGRAAERAGSEGGVCPAAAPDAAALPGCMSDVWAQPPPLASARLPASTVLASGVHAVRLAADASGAFWLTTDGQLWMLPHGDSQAHRLAMDGMITRPIFPGLRRGLFTLGDFVFWLSSRAVGSQTLHRTRKSGGEDVVLVDGLPDDVVVATDGTDLFVAQNEIGGDPPQALLNRLPCCAPREQTVRSARLTLPGRGLFALAVDDENIYWLEAEQIMLATSCGTIVSIDKRTLVGFEPPVTPRPLAMGAASFALAPVGDAIYFGNGFGVARVPKCGGAPEQVAALPGNPDLLLPMGGWIVSSFAPSDQFAGPNEVAAGIQLTRPPAGAIVEIADGMTTPAAAVDDGLLFVDADGNLREITRADLAAALPGAGPP